MTPVELSHLARSGGIERLRGLLDRGVADGFELDFVEWGHYSPEYWRNYLHTHSYYEVCLAYSGAGTFTVDGVDHAVRTGDLFLARPGDVHEIVSDLAMPLGIVFWGFTLEAGSGAEPSRAGWWRGLLDREAPVISRRLGALPGVLTALAAEGETPQSGHRATATSLATALAVATARAYACESDRDPGEPLDRGPVLVALIERYLYDNLDRPISVRDIANVVHLSERHTERLFTGATGESLIAGLRRRRMERAGNLLLESELTVTAVARQCGYSEVRPFSTAFRRHFGQTPSEFRRLGGTRHL
ncbi:AraC family transcriptional regulator [Ruania halotolerans]|uniref:AraC family transcriptional regulator n=1 Tax=Ruania halotolerans TaxID=2897773 RepID=UPI001E2D4FCB|nr:AraC family transcriptional regulator [Ruania halotolerans]UFU08291.1 AraC family transcriptional regulator [Ruania halotolerans]